MNMDLMIDYIPYSAFDDKLCEMLEDDLKFFTNLNPSSSSSPSCLSDEEQLAASNFFDDFLFSSQPLQSNQNMNLDPLSSSLNTLDDTYNSIINSNSFNTLQYSFQSTSSSPVSSASISTVSSSAPSPLSLSASSSSLNAALASANFQSSTSSSSSTSPNCSSQSSPICLSPNQFNNYHLDEFTINNNNNNQNQNKYMQDTFSNNNYNLYPVVNPMDINRNYAIENPNSQSQALNAKTLSVNSVQLPTLVSTSRPATAQMSLNKTNFSLNQHQQQQQTKRCKFTHNQPSPNFNMIKQEQIINSDGESIHSNESDSNSNFSNSSTNAVNTNFSINQEYQPKKVIITTKIEPLSYHINTPTSTTTTTQTQSSNQSNSSSIILNNPQISVIKIPKENLENTNGLKLPINLPLSKNENSQNTKTIIQYKQFINGATNAPNTTTIKQIKNRQNSVTSPNSNSNQNGAVAQVALRSDGKAYPKPPYSYSCLIAMALRNSDSGTLPVSDIYEFIIENFPYYKTARDGWKNSIRHNLSLNKCFEKIENPTNGSKKGCLWALNPDKCKKLEEECKRCRQRDPVNIRLSMSRPDDLNKIERGEQRIKKYTTQRKLMENQQQINSPTSNMNNTQVTQQLTQQSNNQFNDKNFLTEWKNTNIKEEDQDFDELGNTDIKIDPDLFTRVTQTIRTNIQ